MSEFAKSTLTLIYTPANGETIELCRDGQPLLAQPEEGWEHQTQTRDPIGSPWATDRPLGNTRRSVRVQACVQRPTRAALVRYMRHIELAANMHRQGSVMWQEAYVDGVPTYRVRWSGALIMACRVRELNPAEVPPSERKGGVWGCMEWEVQLTHPTEL